MKEKGETEMLISIKKGGIIIIKTDFGKEISFQTKSEIQDDNKARFILRKVSKISNVSHMIIDGNRDEIKKVIDEINQHIKDKIDISCFLDEIKNINANASNTNLSVRHIKKLDDFVVQKLDTCRTLT